MTAWTWNWDSAPGQLPGPYQASTDSGDWLHATNLFIATQSNDGLDHTADLSILIKGDWIQFQQGTNPNRYVLFLLTAPGILQGNYYQFPDVYNSGPGTAPPNNAGMVISIRHMLTSMTTPGEKSYSGYGTSILMFNPRGSVMPWANLSATEQAHWEAAGNSAQQS